MPTWQIRRAQADDSTDAFEVVVGRRSGSALWIVRPSRKRCGTRKLKALLVVATPARDFSSARVGRACSPVLSRSLRQSLGELTAHRGARDCLLDVLRRAELARRSLASAEIAGPAGLPALLATVPAIDTTVACCTVMGLGKFGAAARTSRCSCAMLRAADPHFVMPAAMRATELGRCPRWAAFRPLDRCLSAHRSLLTRRAQTFICDPPWASRRETPPRALRCSRLAAPNATPSRRAEATRSAPSACLRTPTAG